MFAYIRGKLIEASPLSVVLDVGGVGYQIFVPTSTLSSLPQIGEEAIIYTTLVLRENFQALYGFISSHERDLFGVLTNVSGIGPKLALSIIGYLPLEELTDAVTRHDIVTISKVPGIGKKMAEKLIVEMRDKLPSMFSSSPADYAVSLPKSSSSQIVRDAMSALINLGYSHVKAKSAIEVTLKASEEALDLPSLITLALKKI